MIISEFKSSLKNNIPPEKLSPLLKALWYDAKGDWTKSHETAQDIPGKDGAHIHAYLHRKEGDISNASYWYSHAGRKMPDMTLEDEHEEILKELIAR